MELTVNLSGIPIHVGFYHDGKTYQVDKKDVYVMDDAGKCVRQIDDPDTLGEMRPGFGWVSVTTIAEDELPGLTPLWDREAKRDLISDRHAG